MSQDHRLTLPFLLLGGNALEMLLDPVSDIIHVGRGSLKLGHLLFLRCRLLTINETLQIEMYLRGWLHPNIERSGLFLFLKGVFVRTDT